MRYLWRSTPCGMKTFGCPVYLKTTALGTLTGPSGLLLIMTSVKKYPRAILSTPVPPGTISYNRVLRAALQKPLRWGIV